MDRMRLGWGRLGKGCHEVWGEVEASHRYAHSCIDRAAAMTKADNARRYDRQIRIWGAHGQTRFERSRVLLLGCSATGAETLKNLVLGGIASFTIVDGCRVSAQDLGNNFMIEADSLGQPRAQVVTSLLQEMNDSVAGSFVEEAPETLLESNPSFLADFSLVIGTQASSCMHDGHACTCQACMRPPCTIDLSTSFITYIERCGLVSPWPAAEGAGHEEIGWYLSRAGCTAAARPLLRPGGIPEGE